VNEPPEPIEYLSLEDLLEIAHSLIGRLEIRDLGLLASAAGRPQATAFGEDAYPALAEKAAALMHSLARNPPLIDGNKRLAWTATRIFCLVNGTDLRFAVDEAEQLVIAVAAGKLDVPEIATTIARHLA
jgi:death-on-curing protein